MASTTFFWCGANVDVACLLSVVFDELRIVSVVIAASVSICLLSLVPMSEASCRNILDALEMLRGFNVPPNSWLWKLSVSLCLL